MHKMPALQQHLRTMNSNRGFNKRPVRNALPRLTITRHCGIPLSQSHSCPPSAYSVPCLQSCPLSPHVPLSFVPCPEQRFLRGRASRSIERRFLVSRPTISFPSALQSPLCNVSSNGILYRFEHGRCDTIFGHAHQERFDLDWFPSRPLCTACCASSVHPRR